MVVRLVPPRVRAHKGLSSMIGVPYDWVALFRMVDMPHAFSVCFALWLNRAMGDPFCILKACGGGDLAGGEVVSFRGGGDYFIKPLNFSENY